MGTASDQIYIDTLIKLGDTTEYAELEEVKRLVQLYNVKAAIHRKFKTVRKEDKDPYQAVRKIAISRLSIKMNNRTSGGVTIKEIVDEIEKTIVDRFAPAYYSHRKFR